MNVEAGGKEESAEYECGKFIFEIKYKAKEIKREKNPNYLWRKQHSRWDTKSETNRSSGQELAGSNFTRHHYTTSSSFKLAS